jgi:hypothetical protein
VTNDSRPTATSDFEVERRARVRRSAIVLGLVALAFYLAFIVMSVTRAH